MKAHRCIVCGRGFLARRKDAKTCSPACRKRNQYRKVGLAKHTLAGLPIDARHQLDEIKTISIHAYTALWTITETYGADIAEYAINAAWLAAEACLAALELQPK